MVRKILAVSLLLVGMAFFMQCSDDPCLSENENVNLKAGKGGSGGGGGGGHTEPVGNNLSFPVFAMTGITITDVQENLTVKYEGPYTGLTEDEQDILEGYDWYAQKVEGNLWQAGFDNSNSPIDVTFIDWGDVIEAVNPVVGRPFRLETTLYVDISGYVEEEGNPFKYGYTMAMLANPSSPNEIQGTNGDTYYANWATVASTSPTLIIQFSPGVASVWDEDLKQWTGGGIEDPLEGFSFAPELNVGGKYIYGASTGGWRPMIAGKYRLTFFIQGTTNINLASAVIGNYTGNTAGAIGDPENRVAAAEVDGINNLSFVDVTVVSKRR